MASRRHIGGAGDLLAVWPSQSPWLIEVKATKGVYDHFGPLDRAAMLTTAKRLDIMAFLAWRLPGDNIRWVPSDAWPKPR